jgi:hypothetical protein
MERLGIDQDITSAVLLKDEGLPGVPVPALLISLPIDQVPGPDQSDLLGKIRKAMGVPAGLVRFRYYQAVDQERNEVFDVPIHFIFLPAPSGLEQCRQKEVGNDMVQIEMPALAEMMLREDLKREVWKTIRPLAGR